MTDIVERIKEFKEIIAFVILISGIVAGANQYFASKEELDTAIASFMPAKDVEIMIDCLRSHDDKLRNLVMEIEEIDDLIISVIEDQQTVKTKLDGELGIKTYQIESVRVFNAGVEHLTGIGGIMSFAPTTVNEQQIEEVVRLEKLEMERNELSRRKNEKLMSMSSNECF